MCFGDPAKLAESDNNPETLIRKLKEIADMRDETDLSGLKLAIDLKRGTDPDKLKTGGAAEISVDEENIKVVQDSITAGIVSIVFE